MSLIYRMNLFLVLLLRWVRITERESVRIRVFLLER